MKDIEFINASAGSGKTYSLTSRVIEELKKGVAPEGLMATTYTNKAAAELRQRIRMDLFNNGRTDEAQRIFDGFVGTVNSVCARLLKEYALDAGLSPALDILPEEDSARLFKIAISRVIEDYADAIEPAARRLSMDGGGSGFSKNSDWREDVQRIVDLARSNRMDGNDLERFAVTSWESLKDLFGEMAGNEIKTDLEDAVQTAIEELQRISEPKQKTSESLEALKKIRRIMNRGNGLPWSEWIRMSKMETNKDGEGILEDVNGIAGEVMSLSDFQSDVHEMILIVFKCAADALRCYEVFKQKQGLMDFVDQETKVLDLARGNKSFRASIKDRLELMMVDEFQDTSPIQLALFLEFSELAGRSVWVGDPKQAIYGFRGTDPQLMEEAAGPLRNTRTLDKSWRSRETLVKFTNAIFSEVFHWIGKEKVELSIPDERKQKAEGGWIESWNLAARNFSDESSALACGVEDLLFRCNDLKPGDIAILCRKNDQCEAVSASLEAAGIRASVAQGSLLDTAECRLALAALRFMHDRRDRVALTEIVHLSPMHSCHDNWLSSLVTDNKDAIDKWMEDPVIVELDNARGGLKHLTPIEALEIAVDKAQLPTVLKGWSNSKLRMSNLDMLRGVCLEYMDQCHARRAAATLTGFINYIYKAAPPQAQGAGENTVQVLTYHRAKGLEWPVVILTSLDSETKGGAFGTSVIAAPSFDPSNPLDKRSIRYWPWPFGSQKNFDELDERLLGRKEEISAIELAVKESHRLMYVGMTRARDRMILAVRKHETKKDTVLKTGWLDELSDRKGVPLLELPLETGEKLLTVSGAAIPINVFEYLPDKNGRRTGVIEDSNYFMPSGYIKEYPPARISPSRLTVDDGEAALIQVKTATDFGVRIEIKGNPGMDSIGNAIHGFLALDHSGPSDKRKRESAIGLLERWGIDKAIDPDDLMAAEERLRDFISKKYSGARTFREWPISFRNDKGQVMQGWIDVLLELPDGYVIIDHKSYPGPDSEEHAKQYAPQLEVYRLAIEKATGKKVIETLIHMPIVGKVFRLSNNFKMYNWIQ
jgi:ATP-dependent helicase/nuclease subunit A